MEGYYKMWIERCEYMKTQICPKIGMAYPFQQNNVWLV